MFCFVEHLKVSTFCFLFGNKHTNSKKTRTIYKQNHCSISTFEIQSDIQKYTLFWYGTEGSLPTTSPDYKLINSCSTYSWNSGRLYAYVPGASGKGYGWINLFRNQETRAGQESTTASLEYEFSGKPGENIGMRSQTYRVFVWFGFFPFGFLLLLLVVFLVLVERKPSSL